VGALWKIIEAALESPAPLPAQRQRDIVDAVRELERWTTERGKVTSTELVKALEAQAAEGNTFRDATLATDIDRRTMRRRLGERCYYDGLNATRERRLKAAR
jgi:hypothetical protein